MKAILVLILIILLSSCRSNDLIKYNREHKAAFR
jgi:hypothetical protein